MTASWAPVVHELSRPGGSDLGSEQFSLKTTWKFKEEKQENSFEYGEWC